jgi:hypothetical protein
MDQCVRLLAAAAILLAAGCVTRRTGHDPTRRPNILLIVSDDLGYADIGVYGSRDIPTPNIDRLGREGILFTDAYVSGPSCLGDLWQRWNRQMSRPLWGPRAAAAGAPPGRGGPSS